MVFRTSKFGLARILCRVMMGCRFAILLAVFVCFSMGGTPLWARDIGLDADRGFLYTANHDAASITRLDLATLAKLAEMPLEAPPDSLAVDDEGRIWVTSRLRDRVIVLDPETGEEWVRFDTGDQPFDVLHIDETRTAVSMFGAGEVVLFDRDTLSVIDRVSTESAPRGLAISPDRQSVLVTHFRSGSLSVIDLSRWEIDTVIQPEADGNLSQNVAVSDDGARAYLPLTRSNVSNRALLFDTTVFPVVSVIDLVNGVAVPSERVSIDVVDQPVGIPLDVALTDDYLFILNAASNDMTVVERDSGQGAAHLELGRNPRSMVLSPDRERLFVHNALSSTVSVVDTTNLVVVQEVPVSSNPLPASILRGKRLFNTSSRSDIARDQWVACATCHFDGEMDGRTWFFADGPRNTTSLLGVSETLPIHWSGDLDELHDVESTVRVIQGGSGLVDGPSNCIPSCDQAPPNAGRSGRLDDLAAYMAFLTLTSNPNLAPNGDFTDAALRGRKLFHSESTGCANCHATPLYTDRQRYDVGTGGHPDERKGPDFDTPSLRGIHATAPYLHDGRALTLKDVLITHNPTDRHGVTSGLEEDEIEDLVAFLNSLTFEPPVFNDGFE